MLLKYPFIVNTNSVSKHYQQQCFAFATLVSTTLYTYIFVIYNNLTSELDLLWRLCWMKSLIFLECCWHTVQEVFPSSTRNDSRCCEKTNTAFRFHIIEGKLFRCILRNVDDSLLLPTIRFVFVSWKLHHGIFPTFYLFIFLYETIFRARKLKTNLNTRSRNTCVLLLTQTRISV